MSAIVRAEWLKVRSVTSTSWILLAFAAWVALTAWVSWYGATTPGGIPLEHRGAFALDVQARMTADVAGLCGVVLAVLAVASEHTTGVLATTFTAVPRRRRVLAAKALVVAAGAALVGAAGVLVAYAATRAILSARPLPGQSLPAVSDELTGLAALGLAIVMYVLIGLGLAVVTRSTAASITTFVGLWYLAPMVLAQLPAPWGERIGSVLPGALAGQLAGTGNDNSVFAAQLSPLGAALTLAAYIAVSLALAAVVIERRDA